MKNLILHKYNRDYPMTFNLGNYMANDNLYVELITGIDGYYEPWSDLTVNLDTKCAENCAFIDTNNNGDEIIDWLEAHGLGTTTGRYKASGFCVYPEFEFNMEELLKYTH